MEETEERVLTYHTQRQSPCFPPILQLDRLIAQARIRRESMDERPVREMWWSELQSQLNLFFALTFSSPSVSPQT